MSEWISVDDRLPVNGEGVIGWVVMDEEGDYEFCASWDGKWVKIIGRAIEPLCCAEEITHWQPLPDPPQ